MVLAGDFNATPDSELYELVSTGEIDRGRMRSLVQRGLKGTHGQVQGLPFAAPTASSLELHSAHRLVAGREPRFTNYTEGFKGCHDYVMFERKGLACTAVGDFPPESDLKGETALPNSEQPSDHLPVLCRMEFEDVGSSSSVRFAWAT